MSFKKWLEGQLGGIEAPSQERGGVPLSILGANHGNSKGAFMTGGDKPPTSKKDSADPETRYPEDLKNQRRKRKMLMARKH